MKNIKWFSVLAVLFALAAIFSSFFGDDNIMHSVRTVMYAILAVAFAVLSLADRR